jgi:hypothetical protein
MESRIGGRPADEGQPLLLAEHRVAFGFELGAGFPLGPLRGVGDFEAEVVEETGVGGGAFEIPPRFNLVGDFVVVGGGVFGAAFFAVAGGLAEDVFAGVGVEGGDALLRELEVIAAVEIALLGLGVGHEDAVGFFQDGGGKIVERRVAVADDLDVARRPDGLGAVDVEIGDGFRERVERALGVVAGAEETFFFGGDGEEKEAALRPGGGREGGVGLGELEEDGGAGGVVEGAVEDLVAGEFGVAAEVVPVGGEDNVFVAVGG